MYQSILLGILFIFHFQISADISGKKYDISKKYSCDESVEIIGNLVANIQYYSANTVYDLEHPTMGQALGEGVVPEDIINSLMELLFYLDIFQDISLYACEGTVSLDLCSIQKAKINAQILIVDMYNYLMNEDQENQDHWRTLFLQHREVLSGLKLAEQRYCRY